MRIYHFIGVILPCLLFIVLFGCFASKEEKMRHKALPFYNEALDYFLMGQYSMARDKALLAIERYPQFVEAHILFQRIRAHEGEMEKMLREYRKLMKENSREPIYIFLYARLLDDIDEQERLYQKITDISPNCPWGYFGLGWVFYKRQRYSDAAEHFEQAVKIDPYNPLFHLNLGAIYFLMKRNYDAEQELKKAAELSPKTVNVWLNLATVYYQRAEFDKAVESLRKYINLYPAAPNIRKVRRTIIQLNGGVL